MSLPPEPPNATTDALNRAAAARWSADAVRPLDIKLRRAEQALCIAWADGHESVFSAAFLRRNCPCATCRTTPEKPKGVISLPIAGDPKTQPKRLEGAALVGHYAVQLRWSDGHDTGIYDFKYLRTIEP